MLTPPNHLTVGSRLSLFWLFQPTACTFSSAKIPSSSKLKPPIHQVLHTLLEKCQSMKHINQIHAQIIKNGLLKDSLTMGKLIAFCATSSVGNLACARLVFDRIHGPNRFMWNSLIRGYSNSDDPREAIVLYFKMFGVGLLPNNFTFPFVLKSCAFECRLLEAFVIHVHVLKLGFESQVFVQNALLNVYAICGSIEYSRKVFDDIPMKNIVSWNSMIGGYSRIGSCEKALHMFRAMQVLGLDPDEFTLVNLLSASSKSGNLDLGRMVHLYIVITGAKTDLFVKNALLDMYAKCGHLQSAELLFDRMPDKNIVSWTSMISAYAKHGLLDLARHEFDQMTKRNVVSWNAMISCYVQRGLCREALDLFAQMQTSTEEPDEATLVSVLAACSQIGDLKMGKKTHLYISKNNIFCSATLSNALIDMYAKCGLLSFAFELFQQMQRKNLVSWNVMIGALAIHGHATDALHLFALMKNSGLSPDSITFVGILSACSHGGLLDQGRYYFEAMSHTYGVPYEVEHYACMVDLLGQGGHLKEAIGMLVSMPMKPDAVVWGALLGACRTHGIVEIGIQALKQLLELEPHSGGLYVLISNIFCEANRWEDVRKVRKLMKETGIRKGRALSLIQVDGDVHEFLVEDKRHELSSSIYSMLDVLTSHMRSTGYLLSSYRVFLNDE